MKNKTEISKITKEFMKERKITDVQGLQSALKEMLKNGVETLLKLELDEELGYERYDNNAEKQIIEMETQERQYVVI